MSVLLFSLMTRLPPTFPLFPYTTLFRSRDAHHNVVNDDRQIIERMPVGAQQDQVFDLFAIAFLQTEDGVIERRDRKSTRLNSSHLGISYAVLCLKKKIRCQGVVGQEGNG